MRQWWWAVIVSAAVVSAIVPAAIMAATPGATSVLKVQGAGGGATPSAPPSVVFSILWPILFLLAGGTLAYQGLTAAGGLDWAAFALLLAGVVLCWAWPAVFRASVKGSSWLILGILLLTVLGVVLWAGGPSAPGAACALWVPLAVWLVFALMLSVQTQTIVTATGRAVSV